MADYSEQFCVTPSGPCVKATGPNGWEVAGMVILTAGALYGGYQLLDKVVIPALSTPSRRPRLR